ncbi:unnamed protein product [Mortierella alpina]
MARRSRSSEKHRPPSISVHAVEQVLPRNGDSALNDPPSSQRPRSWYAQISSIPQALRSSSLSHSTLSSSSDRMTTINSHESDFTTPTPTLSASQPNALSPSMLPRANRHQSIPISFLINPSPQSSPPSPPVFEKSTIKHPRRSPARHSHIFHPGSRTTSTDGCNSSHAASVHRPLQPFSPPSSGIQSSQVRSNQASSNSQAARLPPPSGHSASALPADRSPRRRSHSIWGDSIKDSAIAESIKLHAQAGVSDSLSERAESETREIPRAASVRKTSNLNLKTTKTGKIQRKTKKIGMNKKSTAYNRFLQQRSKYLSEHFSEWTPQQRMKRIAEEWAVSDKNQHKTRRKSRFLGPDGELQLPSLLPLATDVSVDRIPTSETAASSSKDE